MKNVPGKYLKAFIEDRKNNQRPEIPCEVISIKSDGSGSLGFYTNEDQISLAQDKLCGKRIKLLVCTSCPSVDEYGIFTLMCHDVEFDEHIGSSFTKDDLVVEFHIGFKKV